MSPTDTQSHIKDHLIALLNGIKNSDGHAIAGELANLEEILEKEAGHLPKELVHLLSRRSYARAFEYLGGAAPAK